MSFKVAVASTDRKCVNVHFGKCEEFLIYIVEDDGSFKLSETRATEPVCSFGDHDKDELTKLIDKLADCKFVLVTKIGPGCEIALTARGIQSFELVDYIDRVIPKLMAFEQKRKAKTL
jgi:predicted Fe-Mo cluster-binding NifX family protein